MRGGFSIPIMLRIYFKYDRKLLTKLCPCANETPQMFFRALLGLHDGILGKIHGDPHLHREKCIYLNKSSALIRMPTIWCRYDFGIANFFWDFILRLPRQIS